MVMPYPQDMDVPVWEVSFLGGYGRKATAMNNVNVSLETVRMFKRVMRPVTEEGIISLPEYNEVISRLTSLAEHGTLNPVIVPKRIDQRASENCVNIAFPLMTGTNISAFAVYSIFIRREKTSLTDRIGFLLALAGLFFIAL